MIAIPAIDLRDGACVQLVGGEYAAERVRLSDPIAVARQWTDLGFHRLHVVDLDAATGRGSNSDLVRALIRETPASIQVGGGVREVDAIARLLAEGAERVTVGTRAIEDREWLGLACSTFPNRILVAADVRERSVVTHGWSRTHARDILEVIDELNDFPLAALLVTAVHLEGQMMGTDLVLMDDVVQRSRHAVLASGGIATMQDLRALEDRGVAGAVLGMALYTGALDARAVADEFAEPGRSHRV
ncbi:MAG: 1-(5-phosphoribosyl)-5-[(5-phosphoribosylamino)methylideneamino] imidazole-4-carboxamide isomerase [Gemmatimonadota bacterium]|nr:1-(5-phosphoribosyl)-5-[(5-phosphoribosylamino)methylideneamino] imidazole-4-carboxamide isomerase [Gemmatimonadota bacterium]